MSEIIFRCPICGREGLWHDVYQIRPLNMGIDGIQYRWACGDTYVCGAVGSWQNTEESARAEAARLCKAQDEARCTNQRPFFIKRLYEPEDAGNGYIRRMVAAYANNALYGVGWRLKHTSGAHGYIDVMALNPHLGRLDDPPTCLAIEFAGQERVHRLRLCAQEAELFLEMYDWMVKHRGKVWDMIVRAEA